MCLNQRFNQHLHIHGLLPLIVTLLETVGSFMILQIDSMGECTLFEGVQYILKTNKKLN